MADGIGKRRRRTPPVVPSPKVAWPMQEMDPSMNVEYPHYQLASPPSRRRRPLGGHEENAPKPARKKSSPPVADKENLAPAVNTKPVAKATSKPAIVKAPVPAINDYGGLQYYSEEGCDEGDDDLEEDHESEEVESPVEIETEPADSPVEEASSPALSITKCSMRASEALSSSAFSSVIDATTHLAGGGGRGVRFASGTTMRERDEDDDSAFARPFDESRPDETTFNVSVADVKEMQKTLGMKKWSEIEKAFRSVESSRSGTVRGSELRQLLENYKGSASGAEAHLLLTAVHKTQEDKISFADFVTILKTAERMQLRELRDLYHVFDPEETNAVSAAQLTDTMRSIGLEVDGHRMLRDADQRGDGRLSFHEFVRRMGYREEMCALSDSEDDASEHSEWTEDEDSVPEMRGCVACTAQPVPQRGNEAVTVRVQDFYGKERHILKSTRGAAVTEFATQVSRRFAVSSAARLRFYHRGFHVPVHGDRTLSDFGIDGTRPVYFVYIRNPRRLPRALCFEDDGTPKLRNIMDHFLRCGHLRQGDANEIVKRATKVLRNEPNMLELSDPLTVVGDVHGQLYDMNSIFRAGGTLGGSQTYLFLGDYVDRGYFSCEVVLFLLAAKICYPDRVYLLRGNHESRKTTKRYGTLNECMFKYSRKFYKLLCECFEHLPIYALVTSAGKRFLMCHAGISSRIILLSHIDGICRTNEAPEKGPLKDVMWADPYKDCETRRTLPSSFDLNAIKRRTETETKEVPTYFEDSYFHQSERGEDVLDYGYPALMAFLRRNNLVSLFRAHEVKDAGYQFYKYGPDWEFPGIVTVFSAPNYTDDFGNEGCVAVFKDGSLKFKTYKWQLHPHYFGFEPLGEEDAAAQETKAAALGKVRGKPGSKNVGLEDFTMFMHYIDPDALMSMPLERLQADFLTTFSRNRKLNKRGKANHDWELVQSNVVELLRLSDDPKVRRRLKKKSRATAEWYKEFDFFSQAAETEWTYEMDFRDETEAKDDDHFDDTVIVESCSVSSTHPTWRRRSAASDSAPLLDTPPRRANGKETVWESSVPYESAVPSTSDY